MARVVPYLEGKTVRRNEDSLQVRMRRWLKTCRKHLRLLINKKTLALGQRAPKMLRACNAMSVTNNFESAVSSSKTL
jgi:hypothetical protein